jgi:outer membrane protein assembly factor BamB
MRACPPSPAHRAPFVWSAASSLLAGLVLLAPMVGASGNDPQELLLGTEGNRLHRFDVDSLAHPELLGDVLIERAGGGGEGGTGGSAAEGRDVNGMICALSDGSGRFLLGEDTGQPRPRAGWGLFSAMGRQLGKLTPTSFVPNAEPFGCALDADGILFTTEVGGQGFSDRSGQLIQWFPPYDVFPGPEGVYPDTDAVSDNFCKIAVDLGTATGVAVDEQGRVYVSASSEGVVHRFSPPFPTGPDAAGGCSRVDALGSPLADVDRVNREKFIDDRRIFPPSGIARAPNGSWYVASVLFGRITEFDADGRLLRVLMEPGPDEGPLDLPKSTGSPQGLAVDRAGTLYFADLDLQPPFVSPSPGPDGRFRRIRFDEHGDPLPPETILGGLAFPDGVALLPGNLEPSEWPSYAGGPRRLFFNPNEQFLTPDNVRDLRLRWKFPTQGAITGSPSVALVDVPGEGLIRVVYILSWDHHVYAIRLADGSELWRFETDVQPGAAFPTAASVDVSEVDGAQRVFIGSGEIFYALDAASGQELWRFAAGTGCVDELGHPPGLCGFQSERNQIESSALVHGDLVYFGMDVNDVASGRGGFFALDARDGTMFWFFDPETGDVCRPLAGDDVQAFDGYHSEAELGLPAGFFATRPGCDFDRTPTGCANVWSSPALDPGRGLLYIATSNCDTDEDPGTSLPPPPMPPYDEALVALRLDGLPAWTWRPREVDNDDLAFGATPQLFSIRAEDGSSREVVGIGNKDGTYYVLDRDGLNDENGVAWDDPDRSDLPYWSTRVVPGGDIGGIVGTSAVDELTRRVYISTAPGTGAENLPGRGPPQTPTVHALDLDTGEVVWDNEAEPVPIASFGPTSAIPGLVFVGHVPAAILRIYESAEDRGTRLDDGVRSNLGNFSGLASAPAVVGGTLLVGAGIGTRTASGTSAGDVFADAPTSLSAFCVPGTPDCHPCADWFDNDGDGGADHPDDTGCTSAADLSEEYDCEDGLDNDGDGLRDFPEDPGCAEPSGITEVPEAARPLLALAALLASRLLARRRSGTALR